MKKIKLIAVSALLVAGAAYGQGYRYATLRANTTGATPSLAFSLALSQVSMSCHSGYRGRLISRPQSDVFKSGGNYRASVTGFCQYGAP